MPHCAELAATTHRVDGYPMELEDDIDEFLAPDGQVAAWVGLRGAAVEGHVALHQSRSSAVLELVGATLGPEVQSGVVSRLMVAPAARGQGLGIRLLHVATEAAHGRGLHPVLDVVTTYGAAIRMYERAGWERVGVMKVAMPSGATVDEFVFVGPEPPPD